MHKGASSGNFMERMATFIVDGRRWFFLIYIALMIFCVIAMGWVTVENDITNYLAEDTETRQGLEAMNANFSPLATGRVMVCNVTLDTAWEINDRIAAMDGINMVTFAEDEDHYRSSCALFEVTFAGGNFDQTSLDAMERIRTELGHYDIYIDSQLGFSRSKSLILGTVEVIIP